MIKKTINVQGKLDWKEARNMGLGIVKALEEW